VFVFLRGFFMHSIEVVGKPLYPPVEPPEEVIYWFMGEYLENHSIDLTVVHMDLSDEGVDGWCMREDEHEFIIQIEESLEANEYIKTILHELYHLMQHLLDVPRCEICAYLSEKINLDKFSNHE